MIFVGAKGPAFLMCFGRDKVALECLESVSDLGPVSQVIVIQEGDFELDITF